MLKTNEEASPSKSIRGINYIELYVGNVWQAAYYYCVAWGFSKIAYKGLETGIRTSRSIVLKQGDITLVLTSPMGSDCNIAHHVNLHGDGVKDVAFDVGDVRGTFDRAVRCGARPVREPSVIEDDDGQVMTATIGVFCDTVHSLIERRNYKGVFLPGYEAIKQQAIATGHPALLTIDHAAISVEPDKLDYWIDFYQSALGFHKSHKEDVFTEYSGMHSGVVQNSDGTVRFPIMEPVVNKRKSQIEEYLNFYRGSGVQHVALLTDNIISAVKSLRSNQVDFVNVPDTYYDLARERVGDIDLDMKALREFKILIDSDGWGYLMQTFTQPVQSRPTMFLEVIQRAGARGFGGGNIRSLFEAIEREQSLRGNL